MKNNVILDTDMANEIDDQFALCYLIKSLDEINLQAITIAPFSNSGYAKTKTIEEGTNLSFETTCKILDMLKTSKYKNVVYKGAISYSFENKDLNPATSKIIELAKQNEHTTIIAIGAITNVALAIYHAPEIVNKIDIIWLGGNSFLSDLNNEFNFRQDVEAVRTVFNSGVELTVIPCRNVASNLSTTIYELEHYLLGLGKIGKYLCEVFKNCKKAYRKAPNDTIGESKTLWDISAVAYFLNKDWFKTTQISCPEILDNTAYKYTIDKHLITFVSDLNRHEIYKDFFIKMGYTENTND